MYGGVGVGSDGFGAVRVLCGKTMNAITKVRQTRLRGQYRGRLSLLLDVDGETRQRREEGLNGGTESRSSR